ncbi:hypothetical protein [Jannaschia sp. LMIT008]|uniref:hypothetical protein n=1 Tax=Jannaschia maritima TaxID=3032585 RepID=UPI00281287DC|nr:hypothetical protein [Jannaschia sp. LMIT008]
MAETRTVDVKIDADELEKAGRYGMDLSAIANAAPIQAVEAARKTMTDTGEPR